MTLLQWPTFSLDHASDPKSAGRSHGGAPQQWGRRLAGNPARDWNATTRAQDGGAFGGKSKFAPFVTATALALKLGVLGLEPQ